MLRWILLGISFAALISVWGAVPGHYLLIAFLIFFANFASFCLLYERPMERARTRIASNLRLLNPNSHEAHRLQTAKARPTEDDQKLGFGPMVIVNLATGIASIGILIWGIVLRLQ